MAERRTFRERAKSIAKKSILLLKKLSPERAVSEIRLNQELAGMIKSKFNNDPQSGDWERIKELVSAGANVNINAFVGITPLMMAAFYGRTDVCVFLLANGANLDEKSDSGNSALRFAKSGMGYGRRSGECQKTADFLFYAGLLSWLTGREQFKYFLPSFSECVGL
jgi:hypothetical protein